MQTILDTIRGSLIAAIESGTIQEYLKGESVADGDLLVINNSFLYRDVSTAKSDLYLAAALNEDGSLRNEFCVLRGIKLTADSRRFSFQSKNIAEKMPLDEAVRDTLPLLGPLVFTLIGEINDTLTQEASLASDLFEKVVCDPQCPDACVVEGKTVRVRYTYDEEAIWRGVEAHLLLTSRQAPHGLREALWRALEELERTASAQLVIPPPTAQQRSGLTDSIVEVLRSQRDTYKAALKHCQGSPAEHPESFNELLRISYNFASDAVGFLRLMISVCDLKPLILWGTLYEHLTLANAFRRLPWTSTRNKASLDGYVRAISDARNSAFHNLFPFRKSLRLELPESAIRNASLLLFPEFGNKREQQFSFHDKQLVDVLLAFTRARDRRLPPIFWRQNLEVMDASIALFQKTAAFLRELHPEAAKNDLELARQRAEPRLPTPTVEGPPIVQAS